MKLIEIAQGWINYAIQPDDLKALAEKRLAICDGCPHKKQLSPFAGKIVTGINKQGSTYLCGQCGCPLAAKTINPNSECPLGKWGTMDRQSY